MSIATIVWHGQESTTAGWRSDHILDIDGIGDLDSIEFGIEVGALSFALQPIEIATLLKPRFLRSCLEVDSPVWFLDPSCALAGHLGEPVHLVDLFPVLHRSIVTNDPESQVEAGKRGITGCLVALVASPEAFAFLDAWQRWLRIAYVRRPAERPSFHEALFLSSASQRFPGVGVRTDFVFAEADDFEHLTSLPSAKVVRNRRRDDVITARFETGESASRLAQDLYRSVDPLGVRWPDPTADGPNGFRAWAEGVDASGMPRFARALYWSRLDLVHDFTARATRTRSFAAWLRANGIAMTDTDHHRVDHAPQSRTLQLRQRLRSIRFGSPTIASSRRSISIPSGVNVVGYVRALSGLGEAARATVDAVQKLGLGLSVVDLTASIPTAALALRVPEYGAPYDTTIYHINPGALVSELDRSLHLRGGVDRQVGCFFWETEEVPGEWLPAFDVVDEVWAASEFLVRAFRRVTDKPVRRLHPPFSVPSKVEADRGTFGWSPEEFVVVFVADALSGLDRKNPVGLINVFERAFGPTYEGVRLILKINHANRFPVIAERIRSLGRAPVELWTQPMARPALLQLIASASLYASLHRAEGLGLTLLEAMSLGVPVMATAYGGNLDFMDDTCGLLVDWSPALAGYMEGSPYHGHRWAEPNVDTAVELLRTARREPEVLSRLSNAGRQRIIAQFPVDGHAHSVGALLGVGIEPDNLPGAVVWGGGSSRRPHMREGS